MNKMYKYMAVILAIFVLSNCAVAVYGFLESINISNNLNNQELNENEFLDTPPQVATVSNDMEDIAMNEAVKDSDEEYNELLDNVSVSDEVANKLDGEGVIASYKNLIVNNEMSDENQLMLDSVILNSDRPPLSLALYEFFNDHFFTYEDLYTAEERYFNSESEDSIIEDYLEIVNQFSPTDFEPGTLETLIVSNFLSPDDITIADILSQRGALSFDYIVDLLLEGKNWDEIGDEIGLINRTGKLTKIIITDEEVEKCMDVIDSDREEIVERLVEAKKIELDDESIVDYVESGESYPRALMDYYIEKYQ